MNKESKVAVLVGIGLATVFGLGCGISWAAGCRDKTQGAPTGV